jgi:chromosome segregation ATPase
MIKKGVFAAAGAVLLAVLLFGRDAASYVYTSASRVKDSIRGSVPVEFEIDRAREMVRELVPDIRRNMHVIAKEEVEIEKLTSQIAESEQKLEKQRADVLRLKSDIADNRGSYYYAGRSYTVEQVKTDLANRFERYKTNEATLESLRDILAARQQSLDAARQKLDGMLAAKRQLEVDVENLEARLKMVEVAQTTSEYNFDDSQLSRVKELMTDIRTRLSVAEKLVHADRQYQGEIVLEPETPDDIVEQVTEYFGDLPEKIEVADAD